jgi:HlyD family secretion protein
MNDPTKRARPALFAFPLAEIWAATLLALAVGCSRPPEATAPNKTPNQPSGPVAVETVKPNREAVHLTISEPGYVLAFEETPMVAKVAGYVKEWKADIGDRVEEGQPLAVLSIPEMDVDLARKEALIRQAEADVKLTRAGVDVAEAESKRLSSQSDRLARVGSGVLDKDSLAEARFGAKSAEAKLEHAKADVDVKEAALEVAKKERDQVKTLLAYTTLTAPYKGVVTRRNVNRGDFVQPATGAKGDPLFVVVRTDLMRIFVAVPEREADWVRKRTEARIRVQALGDKEFTGQVARTSWSLDRKERTLLAEIDLPNPDDELRPGMYVYATLTAVRDGVLTLPASSVVTKSDQTQGDQTFCYLLEEDKAVKTPVKTGVRDGQRVEVLGKQTRQGGPWDAFTGEEKVVTDPSKLPEGPAAPPAAK